MQTVQVSIFLFSFFGGLVALVYSFYSEFELALKMKNKGKVEHTMFETITDKIPCPGLLC
jgi:hypothetical protein